MTYAEALRAPVTDEASALAFLQALVDADKVYHLEDSPHDIWTGDALTFGPEEADLIAERVAECYALPLWTRDDCPIGRMMELEAKAKGFDSWQAMMDAGQ